jgi:hypothetical protein
VAATYHQVWWPQADEVRYAGGNLPAWDEETAAYVDPATGRPLPTWDQALDAIAEDQDAEPMHVVPFGSQVRAEGVLGGSPEADRCIDYVGKYMHKGSGEVHEATTPGQKEHLQRLWEAFRFEPCSPTCANWLRYGVQPKHAKPGLEPGFCRARCIGARPSGSAAAASWSLGSGPARRWPTIGPTAATGCAACSGFLRTRIPIGSCGSRRHQATPTSSRASSG